MFSIFESSMFLGLPMGMVILLAFMSISLMSKGNYILDGGYIGIVNQLGGKIYPGLILICLMMCFIFFLNVFGLVPLSFSYSSLPAMTLGFGVVFWLGGYIYCLVVNFSNCVAHFLPTGAPKALYVPLVWIEILSWLCRPLALGVRLMANITAGHLLLFLVGSGMFFMGYFGLLLVIMLLLLVILEVAVAVIQSYVYNLLLCLYMVEGLD
uniref:ATP synthase F0 subunit 6 n=1 Tax=Pyura mirabilis TaxID=111863 RepID=UPI002551EF04|nr:ATP synthase F0 subunit 6 [Pyura mirabilis]UPP55922.1 ATP synthase F0 subunit 6 [Pyura mirabilis]